jgi:hypothetical protein
MERRLSDDGLAHAVRTELEPVSVASHVQAVPTAAETGVGDEPEPIAAPSPAPAEAPAQVPWSRWFLRRPGVVAVAVYLLVTVWITERMWRHVNNYILSGNVQDQTQFEYFLTYATRVVTHFENPFYTTALNQPDGVNFMANTAAYGLTIPLVPVTLLFGPNVSFAAMTFLALFATAVAWYWFFSRYVVQSKFAAFVAGGFCGFAPGMLSQANGHPNIVAQFVVPLILSRLVAFRTPGRAVRNGVILGLLVVYQAFINEEVLFLTALAAGLFILVWARGNRAEARRAAPDLLRGLGVTAVVAGVLLAYPLYIQFFGPQAYHGMWDGAEYFGADVMSFQAFSRWTIAGTPGGAGPLAQDAAEENSFFGWPLLVALFVVAVYLWRRLPPIRAAAITGVVFGLLSLGPHLIVNGKKLHVPGPYAVLFNLPLFDSVITTRIAMVLIPLIALVLAYWIQHALTTWPTTQNRDRLARYIALALVLVALVPLVPRRLNISYPTPVPRFFTSGEWRQYVPPGRTIVPVPLASNGTTEEAMVWASAQHLDFSMPGGYFLGPDPRTADHRSMFGSPPRPTSDIFIRVWNTGDMPDITPADQARVRADLVYWKAAVVVLAERRNGTALYVTTSRLLGFEPTWVDGVWVWDVRHLVS